ncbi:MAG: hypothetical protein J5I94_02290 [Phaeodactylibacter sp.]|nr:hypothetical protein [Phaeodactylibacter sp.]
MKKLESQKKMNPTYFIFTNINYICPRPPYSLPNSSPLYPHHFLFYFGRNFYSQFFQFFPNSFKLVTTCTIIYTFSKPLSAHRSKPAHHSPFYFSGLNILTGIKAITRLVYDQIPLEGVWAIAARGYHPEAGLMLPDRATA